ncbi:hypothetical protein EVG20_g4432 [Dentipellis fragilis]|uniref:glutathione-specific gamma-glutamylcyclotransferase n=1 Tax=Dentipellis fragilis TaxID=205917 RepID=A0A4Y9YY19_9AGAM|nr:hypothetical protein EVG20_g4432 [Dentipellis fragilis]
MHEGVRNALARLLHVRRLDGAPAAAAGTADATDFWLLASTQRSQTHPKNRRKERVGEDEILPNAYATCSIFRFPQPFSSAFAAGRKVHRKGPWDYSSTSDSHPLYAALLPPGRLSRTEVLITDREIAQISESMILSGSPARLPQALNATNYALLPPALVLLTDETVPLSPAAAFSTFTPDEMTLTEKPYIVFGYGSLIYKLLDTSKATSGASRRNRTTIANPGRVVTLIHQEDWDAFSGSDPFPHEDVVWGAPFPFHIGPRGIQHPADRIPVPRAGVAYTIDPAYAAEVRDHLDYREKDGYTLEEVDIYGVVDGQESVILHRASCYVGRSDNPSFIGSEPLDQLAERIWHSVGPSGHNKVWVWFCLMPRSPCHGLGISTLSALALTMKSRTGLPLPPRRRCPQARARIVRLASLRARGAFPVSLTHTHTPPPRVQV